MNKVKFPKLPQLKPALGELNEGLFGAYFLVDSEVAFVVPWPVCQCGNEIQITTSPKSHSVEQNKIQEIKTPRNLRGSAKTCLRPRRDIALHYENNSTSTHELNQHNSIPNPLHTHS
ncbi:hypothetical protein ACFX2I_020317 [Malus domestica]